MKTCCQILCLLACTFCITLALGACAGAGDASSPDNREAQPTPAADLGRDPVPGERADGIQPRS